MNMMNRECGWENCKFNEDGICNQDVYIVSINHPNYEFIYNKNSEDIKKIADV